MLYVDENTVLELAGAFDGITVLVLKPFYKNNYIHLKWFIMRKQSLCVLNPDVSGWWTGRLRGKQGLFPNNYVKKI